jgi:hypothetical protein
MLLWRRAGKRTSLRLRNGLLPTLQRENSRHRGGALLSLGGGKGWTERGWSVSVPVLVASDLFVSSDVLMEPGLGGRWWSVVVS